MNLVNRIFDHLETVFTGLGTAITWTFRNWRSILASLTLLAICGSALYLLTATVDRTTAFVQQTSAQNRLDRQHDIDVGNGIMVCTDRKPRSHLEWRDGNGDPVMYESVKASDTVPWCKRYLFRDILILNLKHIRFYADVPANTRLWITPMLRPNQRLVEINFDAWNRTGSFVMFNWHDAVKFINFDDIEAENKATAK